MQLRENQGLSLSEPDPLSPERYFAVHRIRSPIEAERRLMRAVLEDAVICFYRHSYAQGRRGKRLFLEAKNWIFAGDVEGIFAFEPVCEVLGIAPNYLRSSLLNWEKKQAARAPRPSRTPARHSRLAVGRYGPRVR